MEATVPENVAVVHLRGFTRPEVGWVDRRRLLPAVERATASVHLTAAGTDRQAVKTLSGGNQQKVVLAKWLLGAPPAVFILDEPTRGIDVGAKQEVYRIINELAARGTAVLLVSSELEELIGMCDRILVMHGGRVRDEIRAGAFDRERIIGAAFAQGEAPVRRAGVAQ